MDRKPKWNKGIMAAVLLIAAFGCMTGCKTTSSAGSKVADVDYTVVESEKVPKELCDKIEEKKAADFKLTYETEDALYIVRGYGEQETGGYSIAVNDIYLTINAIYFKTTLLGPEEGENTKKAPSYPYIVVKTGKQKKNVIFD